MTRAHCWCGGKIGPRNPGDFQGIGCLEDITHDWSDELDPAMRKDVQAKGNQPAAGASKNWPHGFLACGCHDDGNGRHVR